MPLPAEYSNAVVKAEKALAGLETLDQRDGSNAIYDAWFAVAKQHAQRKLPGGSETIRAVTIDALARLVRKGVSFVAHTLADDYVVVAMLQHTAKILKLLHDKPKFQALLISPEAVAARAAGTSVTGEAPSSAAACSAATEVDSQLLDIAGTPEERRRFADALPGAFMDTVMAVAVSTELGTERRSSALQVVAALGTLATTARETEPELFEGSALLSAVSSDVVAIIAASSGNDGVLREASMAALRAAAGSDAESYAPRVAKALLSRASDVESLVPVWGMGSLRDAECMDLVVSRIRKEWAAAARKVRDAESRAMGGSDPALSGVATRGFLGIAGGGGSDAVGMSDDSIALPAFTKAAVASLFESLLNDRAESGSTTNILSGVAASSGTGRRTLSAARQGGEVGDDAAALSADGGGGAGTIVDSAAEGVVRVLAESDVLAAIRAGAISRSRLVDEEGGGGGMVGRGSSARRKGSASGEAGDVELADVDMDVAPERSSEWLDLARVALELRPNDERIIRLVLAYPTQESLEMLSATASLFSGATWRDVVLPWLQSRISEFGATVSGSAAEQSIIDAAREWTRSLFESGSAASTSLAIGSAAGSTAQGLPHHSIGRMFFRTCLLAISRGYSETERFPEMAAKILSGYLATGYAEAISWLGDAMAPAITRTNASFRASTEIALTLVGAEAATTGGDVGSGPTEMAGSDDETRVALLRAASEYLSVGSLSMWSSLALNGETWIQNNPECVDVFVEAVEAELDRAIERMTADAGFAKALLQATDALHEVNEAATIHGRASGFVTQAPRWRRQGVSAESAASSHQRGSLARDAPLEATSAAVAEAERIRSESSLGSDPFSIAAASLATLSPQGSRRKVMMLVDTLRAIAHVAPPSSAAALFSALLKGLALLPKDAIGARRSDYEAASLIDKVAAHRTALALASRAPDTKAGPSADASRASRVASARATALPALPAEVVDQALNTLGPIARASLARLFPALCITDEDLGVRLTALQALSNAAWTPRGAALMSSRRVLIGLLQAVPTDFPEADRAAALHLIGPATCQWAASWPYSGEVAKTLPRQFRRLCQGLSRPTSDVMQRSTSSMHEVQVTAAPAVAAAAISTARDADAIAAAAFRSLGVAPVPGETASETAKAVAANLDRAAAVVTACCSRLLMAAVDSTENDAQSLPSRVVVNALGSIASNTPASVLHAMARSPAGRARLDDLRRSSPQWAEQIFSMVASGVLVARVAPQRPTAASGTYEPLPASDTAAALPVPGGVPHAPEEAAAAPSPVPDWGRATGAVADGAGSAKGRYEFEMTTVSPLAAAGDHKSSMAMPSAPDATPTVDATATFATEGSDYAAVLRQFERDTAAAVAESTALARAEASSAGRAASSANPAALPAHAADVLSASNLRFPMPSAPVDSSDTESLSDGVFGAPASLAAPRVGPVGSAPHASLLLPPAAQMAASTRATAAEARARHRGTWAALRGLTWRSTAGRAAAGRTDESTPLTGSSALAAAAATPAGAAEANASADGARATDELADEESLMLLFPEAPTAVALPSRATAAALAAGDGFETAAASTPAASAAEEDNMMMLAM